MRREKNFNNTCLWRFVQSFWHKMMGFLRYLLFLEGALTRQTPPLLPLAFQEWRVVVLKPRDSGDSKTLMKWQGNLYYRVTTFLWDNPTCKWCSSLGSPSLHGSAGLFSEEVKLPQPLLTAFVWPKSCLSWAGATVWGFFCRCFGMAHWYPDGEALVILMGMARPLLFCPLSNWLKWRDDSFLKHTLSRQANLSGLSGQVILLCGHSEGQSLG